MENKLILLKTFNNPIDANIAKGLLASNGINAVIYNENTIYADPILTTALGGVKLLVNETDYSKAIQLFKDTENEYANNDVQLVCPKCGSTEVSSQNKHNWFALLLMLISFSFTPNTGNSKKNKCKKCNHSW